MAMLLLLLLLAMRLILANTCQLTSCLVLFLAWPLAPAARRLHLPQTERERETKTEQTEMETGTETGDWPELALRLCVLGCVPVLFAYMQQYEARSL